MAEVERPNDRDSRYSNWLLRSVRDHWTVIGVVGAILAFALPFGWNIWQASKPKSNEEHVAACRHQHHLAPASKLKGDVAERDHRSWDNCRWPPPTGADEDGFSRIDSKVYYSQGADFTTPDAKMYVLTGSCEYLRYRFFFDHADNQEQVDPQVVSIGKSVDHGGHFVPVPNWAKLDQPVNYNMRHDLVVVTGLAYELQEVDCVPEPSP